MIYDTIIIGGGPAGMTAAIYASRAGLKNLMIEKLYLGGQVANTEWVHNYTGFSEIGGYDLITKMSEHVNNFESEVIYEEVVSLDLNFRVKKVITNKNTYEAKTVILTSGAKPRKLGVKGEELKNVGYCATCDGAFFRGKDVCVIGGGNTAVEDAAFLARFCKNVYMVHRRNKFRAEKIAVDALDKFDNITFLFDTEVDEIVGEDNLVTGLKLDTKGEKSLLNVDGIFVAVGVEPQNNFVPDYIETHNGYIITNEKMETNIKGVFAAGDIRNSPLKQILTATSDGAIAASFVVEYINNNY